MNLTGRIWWMLAVAGLVGAGQARADLVAGDSAPYSLMVSESLAVLANPGNSNVADIAGLTTGHELAVERSDPYFLLTNTSNATLTEFQMTIGNTADHFTEVSFVGALTSAGVSLTSSSTGTDMQDLTLDFAGLAPGDSIAFRVGLAPNSANEDPLVSYGHVFFNSDTGTGASSMTNANSVVSVTFANPASTYTGTLGNQDAIGAASPLTTSENCNCGTHGVGVTAFDLVGGDGTGFVAATPEPSSLLLLGLGLLGLGFVAWRKRRTAQVCLA